MKIAGPAYRVLLHAYPADFRERFGAGMQQAFRDRHRAAAERGAAVVAVLLARTIADVAVNAVALRFIQRERVPMNWQSLLMDARYACRMFARNPVFTLLAVLDPVRAPHHDEVPGIRVGQRPQEQRAGDAEDRGVGADAERQRQDRRDGDARRRGQRTPGLTEILADHARDYAVSAAELSRGREPGTARRCNSINGRALQGRAVW